MMAETLEREQSTDTESEELELTTQEAEEEESASVADDDNAAVVAEESDDVTLELLGDEQDRQNRVEVPRQTLAHLRRTRRAAREEAEQSNRELQEVRQELTELRRAVTQKPRYVDFDSDEAYERALLDYHKNVGEQRQPPSQPQQPELPDYSDHVNAHLDRVEKLGVSAQQYERADKAVRAGLGDVVTDALIASIGEGSEKAMLVIGSRPEHLAQVQQKLTTDPTGLQAAAYLARLAERAKVGSAKKTVSGAPKPTRSPTGGSQAPANDAEFDKRMAKLEKAGDEQGMVQLLKERRKARAAAAS